MKSLAQIKSDIVEAHLTRIEKRGENMDLIRRDHVRNMIKDHVVSATFATHLEFLLDEIPRAIPEPEFYPPCIDCNTKMDEIRRAYDKMKEQEPCDDAISRKLAIRAIKNLYPDIPRVDFNGAKRKWADKYAQYIECERLIEHLPPVTQKSGKWIDYSDEGFVECPFCGHATNCEDDIDELHYCFYCGARMESEDKE